jgi:hypothetical protein
LGDKPVDELPVWTSFTTLRIGTAVVSGECLDTALKHLQDAMVTRSKGLQALRCYRELAALARKKIGMAGNSAGI